MSFKKELEACVQMRVYTLTKRQFSFLGLMLIFIFVLSILIGIFGPRVFYSKSIASHTLSKFKHSFPSGPFNLNLSNLMPELTSFRQELWISAKFSTHASDTSIKKDFEFSAIVDSATKSNFSKMVTLDCDKNECRDIMLLHFVPLNSTDFDIVLTFARLNAQELKLNDLKIILQTYNPTFTYFELVSRAIALFVSFIISIAFLRSMRLFKFRDWTIEQKWLTVILPALLLYNNPFNPLRFVVFKSSLPRSLDIVFQLTFLCCLLLFWLCVYHGMRMDKRNFNFYLPKLVLVGSIWVSLIVGSVYKTNREFFDPTFDIMHDSKVVLLPIEIILVINSVVYLIYILILVIKAFSDLRNLPYFNMRLYAFTLMSVVVFFTCLFIVVIRFSENYLAPSPSSKGDQDDGPVPRFRSAAEISVFFAMFNSYVAFMVIIYSPAKNALMDSNFGDNPSISMLNDDSDEDVMFDSDIEDYGGEKKLVRNSSQGKKYSLVGAKKK